MHCPIRAGSSVAEAIDELDAFVGGGTRGTLNFIHQEDYVNEKRIGKCMMEARHLEDRKGFRWDPEEYRKVRRAKILDLKRQT